MIRLYLVRHAAAEDAASSDALRALTAKARKRFHKTARALSRRVGRVETILTSPLVRAVQTAEILAGEVKHGALTALQELSPGEGADAVLKALSKLKAQSAALVGHEPQLSELVAALAHTQPGKLEIRPGAVVRLDVSNLNAKKAEARWWLRSGGRHKGLPLKEAPKKAAPKKEAPKKAAAPAKAPAPAPAKKKSAPAGESAPAPKKAAAKRAAPPPETKPKTKPKAKAAPRKQPPKVAQPKAAAPAPRPSAPPAAPQKFMGSPRPPVRPATPAPEAPAAPPPPSGEPPPTTG